VDTGRGGIAVILLAIFVALAIPFAVIATHGRLVEANAVAAASASAARELPWAVECTGATPPACAAVQNVYLSVSASSQAILLLRVSVGPDGENARLRMVFTLPVGIMLQPGVGFRIDDGDESRFPVENCLPDGCRAGLVVDSGGRAKLEASKVIHVTYVDADKRPVDATVKLDGFAAALREAGA
jgi:invasion protein IalB